MEEHFFWGVHKIKWWCYWLLTNYVIDSPQPTSFYYYFLGLPHGVLQNPTKCHISSETKPIPIKKPDTTNTSTKFRRTSPSRGQLRIIPNSQSLVVLALILWSYALNSLRHLPCSPTPPHARLNMNRAKMKSLILIIVLALDAKRSVSWDPKETIF